MKPNLPALTKRIKHRVPYAVLFTCTSDISGSKSIGANLANAMTIKIEQSTSAEKYPSITRHIPAILA